MDDKMDDDIFQTISEKCICRHKEIKTILTFLSKGYEACTNSVFVYGNTGTGKTFTIKTILQHLHLPYSYINCVENFTPKLIYEKILKDFNCGDIKSCASMMDFIRLVKKSPAATTDQASYIVFDKAERLRKMDDHVMSAFLRISELTSLNICVIFITEIILEKFFTTTGFYSPITVHFDDYSKNDSLAIMLLDCPDGHSKEFYSHYCCLLVDVFYMVCRDIKEIRHLAFVNFSKYCEPIVKGEIQVHEVRKLFQRMLPFLKRALQTVYLREVSNTQWETMQSSDKAEKVQVDLPYYGKYILLAAYFASYNPANTDRRFFTKKSLGHLSKKTKNAMKAAKYKDQDKKLLGPKPFQLDRLMAIFHSIVPGGASSSGNILNQLSTLVTLQLLMKVSLDDVIDSPKYRCVVSLEFAIEVGKQVDLDVVQYLYNYT